MFTEYGHHAKPCLFCPADASDMAMLAVLDWVVEQKMSLCDTIEKGTLVGPLTVDRGYEFAWSGGHVANRNGSPLNIGLNG